MHDQKVVEMQEFLDEMAEDQKTSETEAAASKKRQAFATKDSTRRLIKMRASVTKLNELKDELATAVSTHALLDTNVYYNANMHHSVLVLQSTGS